MHAGVIEAPNTSRHILHSGGLLLDVEGVKGLAAAAVAVVVFVAAVAPTVVVVTAPAAALFVLL